MARFMLFNQVSPDGNQELYRLDLDNLVGTTPMRLTLDRAYQSWWAKPSPDGTRIVFCRTAVADGGRVDRYDRDYTKVSIWTCNNFGGDMRMLSPASTAIAPYVQGTPNWHPNGKEIIFFRQGRLCRMAADGSTAPAIVPVTFSPAGAITDTNISPDGTRVCFASAHDIWTVPLAGGAAQRLTASGTTTPNFDPVFSPDGSTIAFLTQTSASTWGIRKVPAAGGPIDVVLDDGNINSKPSWSDDGYFWFHRLVYGVDSNFQLAVMSVNGGIVVRITPANTSGRAYPEVRYVAPVAVEPTPTLPPATEPAPAPTPIPAPEPEPVVVTPSKPKVPRGKK